MSIYSESLKAHVANATLSKSKKVCRCSVHFGIGFMLGIIWAVIALEFFK